HRPGGQVVTGPDEEFGPAACGVVASTANRRGRRGRTHISAVSSGPAEIWLMVKSDPVAERGPAIAETGFAIDLAGCGDRERSPRRTLLVPGWVPVIRWREGGGRRW